MTVSIHAPTRGATIIQIGRNIFKPFQSTHPRGVRHSKNFRQKSVKQVSIHAPTRGATSLTILKEFELSCFNPRTHAGCDIVAQSKNQLNKQVSIHAPTRGATFFVFYAVFCPEFQSTHPRGVRPASPSAVGTWWPFQSTHPRGVRPRAARPCPSVSRFNPRTHAGCDL